MVIFKAQVEIPNEIGPPSLTNPIMKLPDGKLLMSIENNKNYHDKSLGNKKQFFYLQTIMEKVGPRLLLLQAMRVVEYLIGI
jgi:hypothetical protein